MFFQVFLSVAFVTLLLLAIEDITIISEFG